MKRIFKQTKLIYVLWHIDMLLVNGCEMNDTTAISRQQLRKYATVLEPLLGSGYTYWDPALQVAGFLNLRQ
jgi:hypothetical protein